MPMLSGRRQKSLLVLVSCLVAGAITGVLTRFDLHAVEAALYNSRTLLPLGASPDPRVVLVTIDDGTLAHFNELAPLSVRTHSMILDAIGRHEPLAVGYALNLARSAALETDGERAPALRAFTELALTIEKKGTPIVLGTSYDVTGEILPPFPLSTLSHGLAMIHRDGASFSGDKVSRRALLQLDSRQAFPLVLAERSGLLAPRTPIRGSFSVPEVQGRYFSFRYHGDPASSYVRIAAQDFLGDEATQRRAASKIAGKIVLIGSSLRDEPSDFASTPFSQEPWASPKLAIHASILDSLLANDGLIRTPAWIRDLVTFLSTALVILLVLSLPPLSGVLSSLGLVLVLALAGTLLFVLPTGLWTQAAHPLLGMLAAYYFSVPYRLLREHQQHARLQRRNEVLVQVEELKTNFLSLVTHDLKTPVARIQGLAEVLLIKAASRLIERDVEALKNIIDSTDELNRFISSILELAKIESAELKPRLESKDLNVLVERAIESFQAQARARSCVIEAELEPLFPIRMDPSLVQKVIHNLLDNALKYSPRGSVVRVSTRESGGSVEFYVTDRGVGLSDDEQEQLFQKFYRAKNQATTQVAGSGLGLYLCKYFIEAHHGSIEVDSQPGQGSTFKFSLPQDHPPSPGLRRQTSPMENSAHVQSARS